MKKYSIAIVLLVLTFIAVTTSAQERKKTMTKKKVRVSAKVQIEKAGAPKEYTRPGAVTISYKMPGEKCNTEGQATTHATTSKGSCSVLGKARPCTCDIELHSICRDGTFKLDHTKILSCEVNETIKHIGRDIPDKIWL